MSARTHFCCDFGEAEDWIVDLILVEAGAVFLLVYIIVAATSGR